MEQLVRSRMQAHALGESLKERKGHCAALARLRAAAVGRAPIPELADVLRDQTFYSSVLSAGTLGQRFRAECRSALDSWAAGFAATLSEEPAADPLALAGDLSTVLRCAGQEAPWDSIATAYGVVLADAAVMRITRDGKMADSVEALESAVQAWPESYLPGRRELMGRALDEVSTRAAQTVFSDPNRYMADLQLVEFWRGLAAKLQAIEAGYGTPVAAARIEAVADRREKEIAAAQEAYESLVGSPEIVVEGAWSQGRAEDQLEVFDEELGKLARVYGLADARFKVRGPDSSMRFYDRGYRLEIEAELLKCGAGPMVEFPLAALAERIGMPLLAREHMMWVLGFQHALDYPLPTLTRLRLHNVSGQTLSFQIFDDQTISAWYGTVELQR